MLEMGEPVRILDLAEKLIRFSGRVPGKDVRIVFTGLRPGEKLIEEQVSALEAGVPTSSEKIRISQTTESAGPQLVQNLSRLLAYLDAGDRDGLLATLCELVPECVPPLQDSCAAVTGGPRVNGGDAGQWGTLLDPSHVSWRERRRGVQGHPLPPDLRVSDRRQGLTCRRKTARVGGRRGTDAGMSLATGSSAAHNGS
jgi:hypothetical protein